MRLLWQKRRPGKNGADKFEKLLAIDAKLAAAGFFAMSDWWKSEAKRYYLDPTAEVWAGQVGRGGVKTGTAAKIGTVETVFGPDVAPGERHFWAHLSENVSEATKSLMLYESFFRALKIPYHRAGDIITLDDVPRGVIVRANRVGAVSGFRCFGFSADEIAKWPNEGAEPQEEVIGSATAMTVTHPGAPRLYFSSPVGRLGFFNDVIERGTNEHQVVSCAPTWIANPSISEAQTRRLEPNDRIWRREYLAEPQATAMDCFDPDAIERAFALECEPVATPNMVIDASSGKGDAFTFGLVGWTRRKGDDGKGPAILRLERIGAVEGRFWDVLTGAAIIDKLAAAAEERKVRRVFGDQREALFLSSALSARKLQFTEHPWTAQNKPQAVERLRRLLADGLLSIEEHPRLRRELLNFEERINPSGQFTYSARRKGHDDHVALLITAMLADIAEGFSGPPTRLNYVQERRLQMGGRFEGCGRRGFG